MENRKRLIPIVLEPAVNVLFTICDINTIAILFFLLLNSEANSILALRSIIVRGLDGHDSNLATHNDAVVCKEVLLACTRPVAIDAIEVNTLSCFVCDIYVSVLVVCNLINSACEHVVLVIIVCSRVELSKRDRLRGQRDRDRGTGYCPAGKDKNITSKAIGTLTSPLSRTSVTKSAGFQSEHWVTTHRKGLGWKPILLVTGDEISGL